MDHTAHLRTAVTTYGTAREARDQAIRDAHRTGGLSYRAIADIVGLSHQRVAQICNGAKP